MQLEEFSERLDLHAEAMIGGPVVEDGVCLFNSENVTPDQLDHDVLGA